MKILYTASYLGKQKYQTNYNLVLKTLHATGNEILVPEKDDYLYFLSQKELERLQYPKRIHYEAIKKAIPQCDAVVMELSDEDFQLGYLATIAVQSKKYTLCLSIFDDFSDRITDRYFFGAKYDDRTIDDTITNFVHQASEDQFSERFNLFLSPAQVQYLEKNATVANMNKSEYLRSLIDQDQKVKGG